jgi:hypothetical protein
VLSDLLAVTSLVVPDQVPLASLEALAGPVAQASLKAQSASLEAQACLAAQASLVVLRMAM